MISWLLSPNILLAVAIVAAGGFVVAYHVAKVDSAYEKGLSAGKSGAAVDAIAEAKEAADDYRAAEAEIPVDAERAYFKRLCARHASCVLRDKYRALEGGKP